MIRARERTRVSEKGAKGGPGDGPDSTATAWKIQKRARACSARTKKLSRTVRMWVWITGWRAACVLLGRNWAWSRARGRQFPRICVSLSAIFAEREFSFFSLPFPSFSSSFFGDGRRAPLPVRLSSSGVIVSTVTNKNRKYKRISYCTILLGGASCVEFRLQRTTFLSRDVLRNWTF